MIRSRSTNIQVTTSIMGLELNLMRGMGFYSVICNVVYLNNCTMWKNMHDHALYLHVLSSSLSRQIVERSSTFAEKVTFQLRFHLTAADIYHCLFGGPLALCLLVSFHINSCVFDKITVFASIFGLKKVKGKLNFAHGNSNADMLPLVKPLEAHIINLWAPVSPSYVVFTGACSWWVHSCLRLIFVPTFLVKMFSLYLTPWPISWLHDFMEKRI